MDLRVRQFLPYLIFISGFSVYLFSSAPALAPYRDMGEMVSVSKTLGVAHPPGYPAYTLVGKLSTLVPLANYSYRVNLASVLGGALSALFLYLLLAQLGVSAWVALATAFLWIGSIGVWTVSIVTEMYSLNLAAALFLLFVGSRLFEAERSVSSKAPYFYLLSFLLGFFCGIRLDLVLLGSGLAVSLAYYLWVSDRKEKIITVFFAGAMFFLLGLSVYLYLLVRSNQHPFLNWRSPDTFMKLWESISRKSHGGTLDLLSENYGPGELFQTNFMLYLKDMARQFWIVGLPLVAMGLLDLFKKNRSLFLLSFTAWFFAGPFFIYKANLPPNPHAYAILEAHFLLPNAMVAVWLGLGLDWLVRYLSGRMIAEAQGNRPRMVLGALLVLTAAAGIGTRWREVSKRGNFFGYDYARNLFATLPPDSIVVMQKDVQLFLLWASQYAQAARPDVTVVAKGLSGSDWYQEMSKRSGVTASLGTLKTETDWLLFISQNPNRAIFAGWDEDVPFSSKYEQSPVGLVRRIVSKDSVNRGLFPESFSTDFLSEFYAYRGRYRCAEQHEFFSSDLIDDYSKAHFARGVEVSKNNFQGPAAEKDWYRCAALNPANPQPYYRLGFYYFQKSDYPRAIRFFERSESLQEEMSKKLEEYHSLPEVSQAVKSDWAEANLNLGVVYEKAGYPKKSEAAYLKTLNINPRFARAHYNIAVLYWNKDWRKVVDHLKEALRIDPRNPEASAFLPKAMLALERSGSKL